MSSIIPVANESNSSSTRWTRDGRKLTYELRVLQQPQRARACGSGAKSSADRRPVDPPPVIELKVFEGEGASRTDITFHHKANFFIFTTLENARVIAHARGQPASQPPVLTGSPVSGAALLDRPSPAAYFIFPDLSVRHEGMYRLSFNLYEELKDLKDEDPSQTNSGFDAALLNSNPMLALNHVRFRMDVRSKAFQVYSAKKFPGLTESTNLSRVVAEQGCRVRIRRDVRMRRRENKSSKDSDHDDSGYSSYPEHQAAEPYRQTSLEQPSSAVSAVDPSYYGSSYPTPTYAQQPLPTYSQQARPSSQQQFHQHTAPASVLDTSVQNVAYGQPFATAYSTPSNHTRHPSIASSQENLAHAYQPTQQTSMQAPPTAYAPIPSAPPLSRGMYHEIDATEIGPKSALYNEQLVEARSLGIDTGYQSSYPGVPRASTPNATNLPSLKDLTNSELKPDPVYSSIPEMYMDTMPSSASIAASIRAGSKRAYDRTFDAGLGLSMANGHRPMATGQDVPQIEADEGTVDIDELLGKKILSYRRANGSLQTKKIPSPNEVC